MTVYRRYLILSFVALFVSSMTYLQKLQVMKSQRKSSAVQIIEWLPVRSQWNRYNLYIISEDYLSTYRNVTYQHIISEELQQFREVPDLSESASSVERENSTLARPLDFFQLLQKPSARCRKLANIGGFGCLRRVEGNKDICLDPVVAPPNGRCLVYSFGVGDDVTFEDSLINLSACETHFFDPSAIAYGWNLEQPSVHRYFHSEGISTKSESGYTKQGIFAEFLTFDDILAKLGHSNTTVHYLKIDIEGGEWEVLRDMVGKNLLKNVVQLSVELHSHDIKDMSYIERLHVLQTRLDLLQSIESAGFRRVRTLDNEHYLCRVDLRAPSSRERAVDTLRNLKQETSDGGAKSVRPAAAVVVTPSVVSSMVGNDTYFSVELHGENSSKLRLRTTIESVGTGETDTFSPVAVRGTHQTTPSTDLEKTPTALSVDTGKGISKTELKIPRNKLQRELLRGKGSKDVPRVQSFAMNISSEREVAPKIGWMSLEHRLTDLLKKAEAGIVVDADDVFETDDELSEFIENWKPVCQEVLYVKHPRVRLVRRPEGVQ